MRQTSPITAHPNRKVIDELSRLFHRNGYVRWPNEDRYAATPRGYKKGCELRLVANSSEELATIRQLLTTAGFEYGQPFAKGAQWRQPLYGLDNLVRFFKLISLDRRRRNR